MRTKKKVSLSIKKRKSLNIGTSYKKKIVKKNGKSVINGTVCGKTSVFVHGVTAYENIT